MLSAAGRATFSFLAGSPSLKRFASHYGMRRSSSFARRFVAGETVAEAIDAARLIERAGMMVTLDLLGESVNSSEGAAAATAAYVEVLRDVAAAGVDRNASLKLTQLGLDVDRATCLDNLRRVLDAAAEYGFFVRIDMESSAYTDATLDIFNTLWQIGYRECGVVIQSYLRRSDADVRRLNEMGACVRLVKGAYREPREVAFMDKTEVDAAFVDLMKLLLTSGTYPAIATHDPAMIEATESFAREQHIGKERYEFQMLYGVRRDLQAALTAEGYRFRVYVPFGREWYPYFMRRLGERPANVGFVLRSMFREGR
jgi:proline dehydrogenase